MSFYFKIIVLEKTKNIAQIFLSLKLVIDIKTLNSTEILQVKAAILLCCPLDGNNKYGYNVLLV